MDARLTDWEMARPCAASHNAGELLGVCGEGWRGTEGQFHPRQLHNDYATVVRSAGVLDVDGAPLS